MMKAIVCGTTFGQSYINAIKKINNIELVGILAFGSSRSKRCAEEHNVPLYVDVDSIPGNIDIAFVIIKTIIFETHMKNPIGNFISLFFFVFILFAFLFLILEKISTKAIVSSVIVTVIAYCNSYVNAIINIDNSSTSTG